MWSHREDNGPAGPALGIFIEHQLVCIITGSYLSPLFSGGAHLHRKSIQGLKVWDKSYTCL